MLLATIAAPATLAAWQLPGWLQGAWLFLLVLIGFSIIIFVHELGHFLAAKWVGIRVDRFAIGFGPRLFGYRRGEGFTWGNRPEYKPEELQRRHYGETDYCFNLAFFGGYVKMLGQDDIVVDEKSGDMSIREDPRAFPNRPIGQRMVVVSAGVIFNVLFAALLFMAVYLVGRNLAVPVIGGVAPDSPAEQAGLREGDRVLAIDGKEVNSFLEIQRSAILADRPIRMRVERDGAELDEELIIKPKYSELDKIQSIGVGPVFTTKLVADGHPLAGREVPRSGDRITHVDGQPLHTGNELEELALRSGGRLLRLTVERPDPQDSTRPQTVECYQYPTLMALPSPAQSDQDEAVIGHILGLVRRQRVLVVQPRSPAERAGFQADDVIAAWGSLAAPTYGEIPDYIQAHAQRANRVIVLRGGNQLETLSVLPERPFRLWGRADARAGVQFYAIYGEDLLPVVADVLPDTPAAALRLPRGALLRAVDERPVANWFDVVEALKAVAGRTIPLRYDVGGVEFEGDLRVPSSVCNELQLPADTLIMEIDGEQEIRLDADRTAHLPSETAVRELLERRVGQTVTVRYQTAQERGVLQSAQFTVQADNTDPWQMRLLYRWDVPFELATARVTAHGDPLKALWMGIENTHYEVMNVFRSFRQMAGRRVSTEHVSGPVGIFKVAIDRAGAGYEELLFFLAFLSVNLAVINFLPVPVLDGGLMVFLIIEKIKGSPLSVKTQMISTIAGLAMIGLLILYVTFQDIRKLLF